MPTQLFASRGKLSEVFSGRRNSIGLLRLCMAMAVVVSHASPVGFGKAEPGAHTSGGQINLGRMAVYGFFLLSGFLITRSALRPGIGRYIWARLLRIMPGLWVCVIVTAGVVAPVLYYHQHNSLTGFWHASSGPLSYVRAQWWTGFRQQDISGVLGRAAARGHTVYDPGFDGALWSLAYEMTCYMVIGLLAVTAVLRNARGFMLAVAILLFVDILDDMLSYPSWKAPQNLQAFYIGFPVLRDHMGPLNSAQLTYLGWAFALGAIFQLYAERIPMSDSLGMLSGIVFVATFFFGGWYAFGIPAFCYLLFWLAVRLPRPFRAVGRKHDFSYGVYIYGFVVEQALCVLGVNQRYGYFLYLGLAFLGTFALAIPSWFLVERQALRLKDWTPSLRNPGRDCRDEPPPVPRPREEPLTAVAP